MSKKINLFVSHYGGDEESIKDLKSLLKDKYDIRDSSIVESDPNNANNTEYIKSIIRPQIDWAGKIIVLIGPKTHERDWVNWEIEHAAKNGDKRIVGVYLRGEMDSESPEMLENYGHACVAWNTDKIVAALEGDDIWQDSNGQPRSTVDERGIC